MNKQALSSFLRRPIRQSTQACRPCMYPQRIPFLFFMLVFTLCSTPAVAQRRLPWYILPREKAARFLEDFHRTDYLYQLRMVGDVKVLSSPSVVAHITKLLDEGSAADRARVIRYLTPFDLSNTHPLVRHISLFVHEGTPQEILSAALVFLEQHMDGDSFVKQICGKADVWRETPGRGEVASGLEALSVLSSHWRNLDSESQLTSLREMLSDKLTTNHIKAAAVAFAPALNKGDYLELAAWIASGDDVEFARDAIYQVSWNDNPETRALLMTQIKREDVAIACEAARSLAVAGDASVAAEIEAYALQLVSKPRIVIKDGGNPLGLRGTVYNELWRSIFHVRIRSLDRDARLELYDQVLAGTWNGNTAGGKVVADVRAITKLQGFLNRD